MNERKPSVFISYSHNDVEWKDKLVRQLKIPAEHHGFEVWHDGQIQAGDDWRERIGAALEATQIAVLLISDEFLNSEFIKAHEVPLLLDLRRQGRVEIVPVLVGACPWRSVGWLERLELRPKGGTPLESLSIPAQKMVLVGVAEEIDAKLALAVTRAERERARARAVAPGEERERPIGPESARPQGPQGTAAGSPQREPLPARPDPPKPAAPAPPPSPPQPIAGPPAARPVAASAARPAVGRWRRPVLGWLRTAVRSLPVWLIGVTALALGLYLWLRLKPERVAPSPVPRASVAPTPQTTRGYVEDLGGGVTLEMVAIPGGQFEMGSPEGEAGRGNWEGPQRVVTVAPFLLGKFEVTQAQWRAVAGWPQVSRALEAAPSRFKGDDLPVERVSWEDAVEFLARLSRRTGRKYRLPSEAEWEYAARAGTKTATYAGAMEILGDNNAPVLDGIAWYGGNSGVGFDRADGEDSSAWPEKQYAHNRAGTRSVGLKAPNAWGLYDMLGNVWEWVEDDWHDSYQGAPVNGKAWAEPTRGSARVVRGGSWNDFAWYVRAACRFRYAPDDRRGTLGFRGARVQE